MSFFPWQKIDQDTQKVYLLWSVHPGNHTRLCVCMASLRVGKVQHQQLSMNHIQIDPKDVNYIAITKQIFCIKCNSCRNWRCCMVMTQVQMSKSVLNYHENLNAHKFSPRRISLDMLFCKRFCLLWYQILLSTIYCWAWSLFCLWQRDYRQYWLGIAKPKNAFRLALQQVAMKF